MHAFRPRIWDFATLGSVFNSSVHTYGSWVDITVRGAVYSAYLVYGGRRMRRATNPLTYKRNRTEQYELIAAVRYSYILLSQLK